MARDPLVGVRVNLDEVRALGDPDLMRDAERDMITSAVDILRPIAMDEAPRRSGRGRSQIVGRVFVTRGAHYEGVVNVGKAFYLRILATGAEPHAIQPFRYRSQRKNRQATRALGPGRQRGAVRALRLRVAGGFIFRAGVQHPGLAPNPWLERAARRGEGPVSREADERMQAVLDAATKSGSAA
jgi:hypothetical protein